MDKLNPKTDGASTDIVAENVEKLRELFPEAFTEGSDADGPRWKVDFDALKQCLGDYVEDERERYSFTWHGKARARQIAQTPSNGTLRPCPEESVNWDTTKNLFIEGDNLEVLKLLQKSYHKQVKMIYIDPPYNTGGEFIYPDRFQDNLDTYLRYTGQVDDKGFRLSANAESSGRYHTNWLNMMYPRLRLARNLLAEDGVLFVSIGHEELANLKKICEEIFGEENFCGIFVWEKKKKPSFLNANMGSVTDYIVAFARSRAMSPPFGSGNVEDGKKYPFNNAGNGVQVLTFPERSVSFNIADQIIPAGDMSEGNIVTELLDEVAIEGGKNKNRFRLRGEWRYSQRKLNEFVEEGAEILISKLPFRPNYINRSGELKKTANLLSYRTNGVPTNEDATEEIRNIFGSDVMSYPKPSGLVKYLIRSVTQEGDLVLDFFAGSGTSLHGLWGQVVEDKIKRRCILVQLPERLEGDDDKSKAAYDFCVANGLDPTIASIGKERVRRVGKKFREEYVSGEGDLALSGDSGSAISYFDFGFRCLKLDSSNVLSWSPNESDLTSSLIDAIDNIEEGRGESDLLYELLLKYGLDLTVPIEARESAGKTVHVIGTGALVVCLADKVDLEVVKGIAALKDELAPEVMRVVFKDSGFADDVVKTNAVQILRQAGVEDVRTL